MPHDISVIDSITSLKRQEKERCLKSGLLHLQQKYLCHISKELYAAFPKRESIPMKDIILNRKCVQHSGKGVWLSNIQKSCNQNQDQH